MFILCLVMLLLAVATDKGGDISIESNDVGYVNVEVD